MIVKCLQYGAFALNSEASFAPGRAVISNRLPAIIAGYSDKNRRLLHSGNDTESIDTEQA